MPRPRLTTVADRRSAEILHEAIVNGSQSVRFVRIVKVRGGHKLRVQIYSDSYPDQSWAKAETWTTAHGWVEVHAVHHASGMATPVKLKYAKNVDASTFRADYERLLGIAVAVVDG